MMKVFHILVDPEKAKEILTSQIKNLIKSEDRDISLASGYFASEDVFSPEDVPPFDRSEVDGYALDHKSVIGSEEDSPRRVKVVGEVEIGTKPESEIKRGESMYISTGAMIPRGADSVVMVEFTSRKKDTVKVFRSVSPGENIAHAGSDFFTNEYLVRKGRRLSPESIALLASSGIKKITVRSKLKVGIVSTGNELIRPGMRLKEGEIYDSNSYYFKSVFDGTDLFDCHLLGTLSDDKEVMLTFVKQNIAKYDILISSGSTSAGFHDLLYQVVQELGGRMLFHGISVKPGKPTFAAAFDSCLFLGMPGFPLSAASILRYIIVPSVLSAYGQPSEDKIKVPLPFRINSEKGKDQIIPAIIGRSGRAYPIYGESGSISRLSYADGFIVIQSSKNYYERDETVPYFPLSDVKRDVLFIGSNDPVIERILFESSKAPTIINAGSWGGVEAIKLGEADVSGIHLRKNGEYNSFLLREGNYKFVMLRGFSRSQGMISRSGITTFSQILNKRLIFVNRNRGSGTRDIIDEEIEREMGARFSKDKIRGYFWEAKSHVAVAKAVKQGRGDAGISIEFYAKVMGLKFHKIRDENYDLIMQEDFYHSQNGKKFVSKLKQSKKYSSEFPGYTFPENIGEPIL
jgi:molybdenum cofactor synthesis domain-containing protein